MPCWLVHVANSFFDSPEKYSPLSSHRRPQPCAMFGYLLSLPGHADALPIGTLLAVISALSIAPVGKIATPPAWPRGYQPAVKYWRASAAIPAARGVA